MVDMRTDATPRRCGECQSDVGANDKFCKLCGAKISAPVGAGASDNASAEPLAKDIEKLVHQTYDNGPVRDTAANTPPRLSSRWFHSKWLVVVGITVVVAAIYFWQNTGHLSGVEALDLKVEKLPYVLGMDALQLTNVGNEDIEITDITINDRDECTRFTGWLPLDKETLPCTTNGVTADNLPPFVQHMTWVGRDGKVSKNPDGDYFVKLVCDVTSVRVNVSVERGILKVGDNQVCVPTCHTALIRATIKTNHGTAGYRWE